MLKTICINYMLTREPKFKVLLRWGAQHNCALLPKSVNPQRQQSNLQIFRNIYVFHA